ncbi:hypothetical protein KC344_g89 [Hortaea werneckii]|nr:hypothetical protein KC344_g89 [Hortaea werneckii]
MVSSISPPQGTSEHPSGYVALGRRDDVSNSDGVAKFREEDVKIPPDVSAIRSPPRFCRLMQYHLRHCIEIRTGDPDRSDPNAGVTGPEWASPMLASMAYSSFNAWWKTGCKARASSRSL